MANRRSASEHREQLRIITGLNTYTIERKTLAGWEWKVTFGSLYQVNEWIEKEIKHAPHITFTMDTPIVRLWSY